MVRRAKVALAAAGLVVGAGLIAQYSGVFPGGEGDRVAAVETRLRLAQTAQTPEATPALDGWGRPLRIEDDAASGGRLVRSAGKDGAFGTDDDLFQVVTIPR